MNYQLLIIPVSWFNTGDFTPPTNNIDHLSGVKFGQTEIGGTLTIEFDQPIVNPTFHWVQLDRAGWDFTPTPGLGLLTKLSGNSDMLIVNGTTVRDDNGENDPGAFGSVQLSGTYTTVVVNLFAVKPLGDGYNFQISTETIPKLSCIGYDSPFEEPIALNKKSKRTIPLKMTLLDADGTLISETDFTPPVVNVTFGSQVFGESPPDTDDLLPQGAANVDNVFRYDNSISKWVYNLGTGQFTAAGTYTVKPIAGDTTYTIDTSNTCVQTFERPD